jgi:hypothetical protein
VLLFLAEAGVVAENLAPKSSLKDDFPGYVDKVKTPTGPGVGGGGGPGWSAVRKSELTVRFPRRVSVSNVVFYVGCNDRETMGGKVEAMVSGRRVKLATFRDVGCGGSVAFTNTVTDVLFLTMTDGGGYDRGISVQEIEIHGTTRVVPQPGQPLNLVVELRDKSTVAGVPNLASLSVQTPAGKMDIPLRLVETAERGDREDTFKIVCSNGDVVQGTLLLNSLTVSTGFDKQVIPLPQIVRFAVSTE